jgi:predicted TIM-barrel fold metal-dependent hydrolase
MERTAIISVDGHVRAARATYRDYVERRHLDVFDEWVRSQEELGVPDQGGVQPGLDAASQWDSEFRMKDMESQGVVAEVLFPNGVPFEGSPAQDASAFSGPELDRAARMAYNRWLADFCALAPGRRAGQALISFDDVEQAVRDIHWARDQGLGGVMMPALRPGGTFFFDPALDPVWAAGVDVDLPVSQHGGSGVPAYGPQGFAAIMTLALEHSFYSGRSLWQLILGGVFERFSDLRIAFVET